MLKSVQNSAQGSGVVQYLLSNKYVEQNFVLAPGWNDMYFIVFERGTKGGQRKMFLAENMTWRDNILEYRPYLATEVTNFRIFLKYISHFGILKNISRIFQNFEKINIFSQLRGKI